MADKDKACLGEELLKDTCGPCMVDGNQEEAVKYCPECEEHLCATCVRYHGRLNATKSHELVDRTEQNNENGDKEAVKCLTHPDRNVEMYCSDHDMVFCLKCITEEHRACNGLMNIDDAPMKRVQNEMHRLHEDIESFNTILVESHDTRQKNIDKIENRRQVITTRMRQIENDLIEYIRCLTKKGINNVDMTCLEVKDELMATNTSVNDLLEETDNMTKRLDGVATIETSQQFAMTKLLQKSLKEIQTLYESSIFEGSKAIYLTENVDLQAIVSHAKSIGEIHLVTEDPRRTSKDKYTVKSKIWVTMMTASDKFRCIISDICILADGTILVTDHGNKKLKRLDRDYNIKDHLDLESIPTGSCCTAKDEVCLKLNNNKLQFISTKNELCLLREVRIKDGSYYGLAFFCGELWLSRCGGVDVYNTFGEMIKSFGKDEKGNGKIFKTDTIQHMVVRENTVIVTDNSDGAVGLDKDGDVTSIYRDASLKGARGVCASGTGSVFIAGCKTDNIAIFSGAGAYVGELVPKDAAMQRPVSLCYDVNRDRLLVTCENTNDIYIFELE